MCTNESKGCISIRSIRSKYRIHFALKLAETLARWSAGSSNSRKKLLQDGSILANRLEKLSAIDPWIKIVPEIFPRLE